MLILGIISCSSDDDNFPSRFEFVTEYTAIVTVVGGIGIRKITFEIG